MFSPEKPKKWYQKRTNAMYVEEMIEKKFKKNFVFERIMNNWVIVNWWLFNGYFDFR